MNQRSILLRRLRIVLSLFMVGLILSGVTAFPLLKEMEWVISALGLDGESGIQKYGALGMWLRTVRDGLKQMYSAYPWIAYGTDWLAFAHIVLAIFFIGPWKDPVSNVWVLKAGLIACVLVLPLALLCGPIRGIPFGWRLIDCSFGVFGAIPLWYCLRLVKRIEHG
jgi:hypothetical protein